MNKQRNFKIVILEDDDFYNKILTRYLTKNLEELGLIHGFTVSISSYTSFMDCSKNLNSNLDIMFTDYYLSNGYNAPLIMDKLKKLGITCKVIVMSRLQNMQTEIAPMLDGAIDFIRKDNEALKKCLYISEAILMEKLNLLN